MHYKIIFLIEPVKICDDLNDENQYLCLQLNCPNQIKCHKNHIVYLKLILLLSFDKTTANSKRSSEKELEKFQKQRPTFIHLNINSLLSKIDELREIVKISNPTVTGITETKIDNSINNSEFYSPFGVIETKRVEVQPVTSLIRFVTILKIVFQMKQKISLSKFVF